MSADTVVTWIGLALAIVGIGITIWQLQKTKSAAEAARDAVRNSEARTAGNLLLSALPGLLSLEIALKDALFDGRNVEAIRILTQWRHKAAEVEGLVRRNRPRSMALADRLVAAVTVASDADRVLSGASGGDLAQLDVTLHAIAQATSAASAELADLQAYTGGHEYQ